MVPDKRIEANRCNRLERRWRVLRASCDHGKTVVSRMSITGTIRPNSDPDIFRFTLEMRFAHIWARQAAEASRAWADML